MGNGKGISGEDKEVQREERGEEEEERRRGGEGGRRKGGRRRRKRGRRGDRPGEEERGPSPPWARFIFWKKG